MRVVSNVAIVSKSLICSDCITNPCAARYSFFSSVPIRSSVAILAKNLRECHLNSYDHVTRVGVFICMDRHTLCVCLFFCLQKRTLSAPLFFHFYIVFLFHVIYKIIKSRCHRRYTQIVGWFFFVVDNPIFVNLTPRPSPTGNLKSMSFLRVLRPVKGSKIISVSEHVWPTVTRPLCLVSHSRQHIPPAGAKPFGTADAPPYLERHWYVLVGTGI